VMFTVITIYGNCQSRIQWEVKRPVSIVLWVFNLVTSTLFITVYRLQECMTWNRITTSFLSVPNIPCLIANHWIWMDNRRKILNQGIASHLQMLPSSQEHNIVLHHRK
jgi:hypothetical protein